jgi:hypothetical protein
MRQSQRVRIRISVRRVFLIASGFCILLAFGLTLFINLSNRRDAFAASPGDYRTKTSGDWNNPAIWEKFNGTSWVNAAVSPSSADGAIEIQNGHYITISSDITVDQLLIDESGMIANTSGTVTIMNGIGSDVTVNGFWNISGAVSFTSSASMTIAGYVFCQTNGAVDLGTGSKVTVNNYGVFEKDAGIITETAGHWIINSGGSYRHNQDGGKIPFASWIMGSSCEITGALFTAPSNLDQPFSNFSWSCASQPGNLTFNGELKTVKGDFRMTSTGTGSVKFNTASNNLSLNIGGNYYQDGGAIIISENGSTDVAVNGSFNMTDGTLLLSKASSAANGNVTLKINGDLSLSGGTIDMSQYDGSMVNKGIGSIYLKGDLANSGGVFTTSSTAAGAGNFHFAKTGSQTIIGFSTFGSHVDVFVDDGATLNLDNKILAGEGNFTLSAGGGLILGHFNGISASSPSGNIQVSGRRTFSVGANYTYKAGVAQLTGDGLPALVNNLTVDNSSGVILSNSVTVSNTLNIVSGNINTYTDTLKLGVSNSMYGTLLLGTATASTVTGWFGRWISSDAAPAYLFPVSYDSRYYGVNMVFTSAPISAGYITMHFAPLEPGETGLPLKDGDEKINNTIRIGFWNIQSNLQGAQYNMEVYAEGFQSAASTSAMRLLYRESGSESWTINGTHSSGTITQAVPVIHRLAVNKTSGQFSIGWIDDSIDIDANDHNAPFTGEPVKGFPINMVIITKVFPIPFFENLKLDFISLKQGNATVKMINTAGEIVVKENIIAEAGTNTWNFVENINLVAGVYYISVQLGESRATRRVIKYS